MKGIGIFLCGKNRMIVFSINISIKLKKGLILEDFSIGFIYLLLLLKKKLDRNKLILEFNDNSIFDLLSLRGGLLHLQLLLLIC